MLENECVVQSVLEGRNFFQMLNLVCNFDCDLYVVMIINEKINEI